jgi:hypothetical protein
MARKPVIYFTWDQIFDSGLAQLPSYTKQWQAEQFAQYMKGRSLTIGNQEVGQVVETTIDKVRELVGLVVEWSDKLSVGIRL